MLLRDTQFDTLFITAAGGGGARCCISGRGGLGEWDMGGASEGTNRGHRGSGAASLFSAVGGTVSKTRAGELGGELLQHLLQ